MSDAKRQQLQHEYTIALREVSAGAGEAALAHAYEIGRVASGGGIGVVEVAMMYDAALHEVLGDHAPSHETAQVLAETLSPFEMTHRGFREAYERLEAAHRELEAFSYSVSHDLRAPLRTISAFTRALSEDLDHVLDAKSRDHMRRVLAAAARMSDLIDALLELSRISRGPLGRHPVDLGAIATAVVDELQRREPERQVELVVASQMVVEADGRLVRILLDNLLGNAWKFTARTPHTRIEVGFSATAPTPSTSFATMALASTWRTPIACSRRSIASTRRPSSRAPASDWRPRAASSIDTAVGSGRRGSSAAVRPSTSRCRRDTVDAEVGWRCR